MSPTGISLVRLNKAEACRHIGGTNIDWKTVKVWIQAEATKNTELWTQQVWKKFEQMLSVHTFLLQSCTVGHMNQSHQYADVLTCDFTALTFIWLPRLLPANISQPSCKYNLLVNMPLSHRLEINHSPWGVNTALKPVSITLLFHFVRGIPLCGALFEGYIPRVYKSSLIRIQSEMFWKLGRRGDLMF